MFEELKMIRSKIVVLASVVMLLFVTGCNKDEAADENIAPSPVAVKKKQKAAPGASPATGAKASKTTAAAPASPGKAKPKAAATAKASKATAGASKVKQTLGQLNGYLPAAVTALQSDDVDTAKQYVKGFSDNWKQQGIQGTVKKQSQASFNKISAGVNQVNKLMRAPAPDKAKATTAIQSLSQAVSEYTKGS
jgi:hypothetical protein